MFRKQNQVKLHKNVHICMLNSALKLKKDMGLDRESTHQTPEKK